MLFWTNFEAQNLKNHNGFGRRFCLLNTRAVLKRLQKEFWKCWKLKQMEIVSGGTAVGRQKDYLWTINGSHFKNIFDLKKNPSVKSLMVSRCLYAQKNSECSIKPFMRFLHLNVNELHSEKKADVVWHAEFFFINCMRNNAWLIAPSDAIWLLG